MSDNRGLIGKLLKLGAAEATDRDGWRRIGRPLDRDPLAAVLREIDETQLPRELSFRNDQGQELRVEAGNRRLRRIVSASVAGSGPAGALLGQQLVHASDIEIDAIGDLLRAFQPGDREVWVHSEQLPQEGDRAQTGVAAAALAGAFSVDLDDRTDANLQHAFEAFVAELNALSSAWIRYEAGKQAAASEPVTDTAWRDRWDAEDVARFQVADDPVGFAPILCILGSGVDGEPHDAVAVLGGTGVVWRLDAAEVAGITARWRDLGL